jgi:hypothetical protein
MKRSLLTALFTALLSLLPIHAQTLPAQTFPAQTSKDKPTSTLGPRLVRFAGTLPLSTGPTGAVGVIFSIFTDETGGTGLWSELQNVIPDANGRYASLLGSTTEAGIPAATFNTAESRWLQVEIPGQPPLPRTLMVSVPYALKAADADTLGGIPASAFLLAASASTNTTTTVTGDKSSGPPTVHANVTGGTANYLGKFTNSTDLGNSSVYDSGTSISIGGTSSLGAATLIGNVPGGDAPGMALFNIGSGANASVSVDFYNTIVNSGIPQAKLKAVDDGNYSDHLTFWTKTAGAPGNSVLERMRLTSAGNLGIGTTTPVQKLDVSGAGRFSGGIVFGDGTTQTTADKGGTVTGITAGTGITTSGTTNVTVNVDATKVPFLNTANTFTANQGIMGNLTATGSLGIGTTTPAQKLDVVGTVKTSGGILFGDGTTQTTAPPQIWSSNTLLTSGGLTQLAAAPSGVGTANPYSFQAVAMPLPQNCTASNLKMSIVGATGTSTAQVSPSTSNNAQLTSEFASPTGLSCTVTASAGSVVSCSSSSTATLSTPLFLSLYFSTQNSGVSGKLCKRSSG